MAFSQGEPLVREKQLAGTLSNCYYGKKYQTISNNLHEIDLLTSKMKEFQP